MPKSRDAEVHGSPVAVPQPRHLSARPGFPGAGFCDVGIRKMDIIERIISKMRVNCRITDIHAPQG